MPSNIFTNIRLGFSLDNRVGPHIVSYEIRGEKKSESFMTATAAADFAMKLEAADEGLCLTGPVDCTPELQIALRDLLAALPSTLGPRPPPPLRMPILLAQIALAKSEGLLP